MAKHPSSCECDLKRDFWDAARDVIYYSLGDASTRNPKWLSFGRLSEINRKTEKVLSIAESAMFRENRFFKLFA